MFTQLGMLSMTIEILHYHFNIHLNHQMDALHLLNASEKRKQIQYWWFFGFFFANWLYVYCMYMCIDHSFFSCPGSAFGDVIPGAKAFIKCSDGTSLFNSFFILISFNRVFSVSLDLFSLHYLFCDHLSFCYFSIVLFIPIILCFYTLTYFPYLCLLTIFVSL